MTTATVRTIRTGLLLALCWVAVRRPVTGQGFSPEESVRQMTMAEGFEVALVASEPLVRQPVAIEFDDRGRLWVIQYLQYPNPAGLKRVEVDQYSRTKYDRVPEPPPHGPRGADRITILEDTDGDGRMDWGLDFDRVGNLLYSTNFGGYVLLHGVQGGLFVKSFAKHGSLHNRHAYGYFHHALHENFRGGHVTVGGIVYQGDSFPPSFRDTYIAGDLLGHAVYWHNIEPHGSTFRTAHGGELLVANDTWFAPTDVTMGPDGAIYVTDWHDARTAHPDPDAQWDRSNGRIYRIAAKGTKPAQPIDMARLSTDELLKLHEHRSSWYVRRARQELARRRNHSAAKRLRDTSLAAPEETAASVETKRSSPSRWIWK